MYSKRLSPVLIALIFMALLGLVNCEYDGPTKIWDPDKTAGINPVITEIIPDAIAEAGINEIKIIGENFSPNIAENLLYVNGVKVPLKSASSTELVIYRPKFTGDSLTIKLVKPDAYEIAEYFPYAIEKIGGEYGETVNNDYLSDFDLDADENFTGHDRLRLFITVPHDGVRQILYECDKIRKVYDMKVGPGGAFYIASKKNTILVSTPENPDGTSFGNFNGNITKLDFDQWGNIYAGGDNIGISVIRPDTTISVFEVLKNYSFSCIRVYDSHVYVSGTLNKGEDAVETGIWRLPIQNSSGQLGDVELVMNWNEIGVKADTTELIDFTFAADGTMFMATDGGIENTDDPIIMRYPDGTVDTFYPGGLLQSTTGITGPIVALAWGNDKYLYYWRGGNVGDNRRIIRLKMQQQGAPYYGRIL